MCVIKYFYFIVKVRFFILEIVISIVSTYVIYRAIEFLLSKSVVTIVIVLLFLTTLFGKRGIFTLSPLFCMIQMIPLASLDFFHFLVFPLIDSHKHSPDMAVKRGKCSITVCVFCTITISCSLRLKRRIHLSSIEHVSFI